LAAYINGYYVLSPADGIVGASVKSEKDEELSKSLLGNYF
jgi:hypothetical protein